MYAQCVFRVMCAGDAIYRVPTKTFVCVMRDSRDVRGGRDVSRPTKTFGSCVKKENSAASVIALAAEL